MPEKYYVRMVGTVTVTNGDVIHSISPARNHIVDTGMKGILSALISQRGFYLFGYTDAWNIWLGTNKTTATTQTMTTLASMISVSNRSKTRSVSSSGTTWAANFNSVWPAGTVSGTIGEIGLWLKAPTTTTFRWTGNVNPALAMCSRLSVADGDFASHTINTANPLSVDWTISFSFV